MKPPSSSAGVMPLRGRVQSLRTRCAGRLLPGLGLLLLGLAASAANDFSAAEKALFVTPHLAGLHAPTTLHYSFHKTGSLEPPLDDKVDVLLSAGAGGTCCVARVEFLGGAKSGHVPEVDAVQSNPVILHFLERDIHEMERLTQGRANYFRKRIRMAVFEAATIRKLRLPYHGHAVDVQEISITPYRDDPNRSRYEKLADKQYQFLLASAVPGGLYAIRTRIGSASVDAPLLGEELLIDGAQSATDKPQP